MNIKSIWGVRAATVGGIVARGVYAACLATAAIGCAPIDADGTSDEVDDPEENRAQESAGDERLGTAELSLSSLGYSTYFGGAGDDSVNGTALDSAGNLYVVGTTTSYGTGGDIFVRKMSPTGAVFYSVSFGGAGSETGVGIAVSSDGYAYVVGTTKSYSAQGKILVAKLNQAGTGLLYNTYFGGDGGDTAGGIAIDSAGNAYLTGTTGWGTFPTTAGAFQTVRQGWDSAFVTKINAAGNALVYSTYLGGYGFNSGYAIAVDSYGYAYVTGLSVPASSISSFPVTLGAFQTKFGGNGDAFVAKLIPSGAGLSYATYLGGSTTDAGRGIAVDTSFNAYVTGYTSSINYPTTFGAFRTTKSGPTDAFVTKLNAWGNGASYSTYLGGSQTPGTFDGETVGNAIAVNAYGNAYVTGTTYSLNFPTTVGALRTTRGGPSDAFVTELSTSGSSLLYSTYVGGSLNDSGQAISVYNSWDVYVGGNTQSTNFPTVWAAQPAYGGGGTDAFTLKIVN